MENQNKPKSRTDRTIISLTHDQLGALREIRSHFEQKYGFTLNYSQVLGMLVKFFIENKKD